MNIDEDDFSDEYDMMDDDDEEAQVARRNQRKQDRQPKKKYMELLQRVVDREEDEVAISLDDLAKVCNNWDSLEAKLLMFVVR